VRNFIVSRTPVRVGTCMKPKMAARVTRGGIRSIFRFIGLVERQNLLVEDNIKVGLRHIGCNDVSCTHLARYMYQRRALVNMVMKFSGP